MAPKVRHCPLAWSEIVCVEQCPTWSCKMQLQSTENWTGLVEFSATVSGPFACRSGNLLAPVSGMPYTRPETDPCGLCLTKEPAALARLLAAVEAHVPRDDEEVCHERTYGFCRKANR